jgi:hypothetical protein
MACSTFGNYGLAVRILAQPWRKFLRTEAVMNLALSKKSSNDFQIQLKYSQGGR